MSFLPLFILLSFYGGSVMADEFTSRVDSIEEGEGNLPHLIKLENGRVVFLDDEDKEKISAFHESMRTQNYLEIVVDDENSFESAVTVDNENAFAPAVRSGPWPYLTNQQSYLVLPRQGSFSRACAGIIKKAGLPWKECQTDVSPRGHSMLIPGLISLSIADESVRLYKSITITETIRRQKIVT